MERTTAVPGTVPLPGRAELVRLAAHGDADAFERLVATHADRAFRIARAILGNEADARDATQDAFVSAWREVRRLRDADQFEAWLNRIVVNACRMQLRRRTRVREVSLETTVDHRADGPAISDQIGDAELLERAFERLDASKRTILVLHYVDHQPVADIAAVLGIPAGTVKWRLSDARAALSRALVAEGEARR